MNATTKSTTTEFEDEEVESSRGYLSGYRPKRIAEQTNHLRELFPGIGYADEKLTEGALPPNAEGWFAIPKWQNIAPTYNEAVRNVLDMIKLTRIGKFYNYCEGQLGPERLRQTIKTAGVFQKLGDEQKDYDTLLVPAQFGILHRGRSVRLAREVFASNEFDLGAFAIGIMILTHPERLMNYDDLWIDCSGDEYYDPNSNVRFDRAPYFSFGSCRVRFGTRRFSNAHDRFGSASGFIPEN